MPHQENKPADLPPAFGEYPPLIKAHGMTLHDYGKDYAVFHVPYDKRFIGYPKTGVFAGGVITTALDHASGVSCFIATEHTQTVATVDLRIDYMRPAEPGQDLYARAHCFKMTRLIAFVRGVAYHNDPSEPVATSIGTFMFTGEFAHLEPKV